MGTTFLERKAYGWVYISAEFRTFQILPFGIATQFERDGPDIRVNHVGFMARGQRLGLSLASVNSPMETTGQRQLTYESASFVSYPGPPIWR
jgi:hypothetical protein